MKNEEIILRISKSLYDKISKDLHRSHPFAYERVGFVSSKWKQLIDNTHLITLSEYHPISDHHYIEDSSVGARIGSAAILNAMQRAITQKTGSFHIHMHLGKTIPGFSGTDLDEIPKIVKSMRNTGVKQAFGMLVINDGSINGLVWLPDSKKASRPSRITIVGSPMTFVYPDASSRMVFSQRHLRQTFLGSHSINIFRRIKVGIVGLGGGGSHIALQLAHIGIHNYVLFDSDTIEESNLNRVVGATVQDVKENRPKVDISERVIKSVIPKANIVKIKSNWQENPEFLQRCDIVVGCVDTFSGRGELEVECRRYLIPYIDIGMDVHSVKAQAPRISGQVILSLPGNPCMKCLGYLTEDNLAKEAALYGDVGGRPQVVWSNGVLASSAIAIIMEIITGWTEEPEKIRYLSYDGNSGNLVDHVRLKYLRKKECTHFSDELCGPVIYQSLRNPGTFS